MRLRCVKDASLSPLSLVNLIVCLMYNAVPNMKLFPLLCFILSPLIGLSSAQLIRPQNVVTVSEGEDALLPCRPTLDSGQSIDKFDWRKNSGEEEKKEVFFYDRGSHYRNGLQGQSEQFNDRIMFFQDELNSGNASIIVLNTRLEDNGTYTCVLFQPHRQEVTIWLNVVSDLKIRNISGAAPVPYVKQVRVETTWWLLQCKAHGVPKPKVEWRNSAGERFPAELTQAREHEEASGRFHVDVQVNVTRSDTYTCVVTQRDIYHQTDNTLIVHIQAEDFIAVSEGDDVILLCSLDSKEITKSQEFSWRKDNQEVFFYDRGRVDENKHFTGRLTIFQNEIKSGNVSIKIHNTQTADSGRYSCCFENIQKSYMMLYVAAGRKSEFYSLTGWIVAGFLILVIIITGAYYCHQKKHSGQAEHERQQLQKHNKEELL